MFLLGKTVTTEEIQEYDQFNSLYFKVRENNVVNYHVYYIVFILIVGHGRCIKGRSST